MSLVEGQARQRELESYVTTFGTPGDIEFLDARLPQRPFMLIQTKTQNQKLLPDANAHIPVHQEPDPAEHLLFRYVLSASQEFSLAGICVDRTVTNTKQWTADPLKLVLTIPILSFIPDIGHLGNSCHSNGKSTVDASKATPDS